MRGCHAAPLAAQGKVAGNPPRFPSAFRTEQVRLGRRACPPRALAGLLMAQDGLTALGAITPTVLGR